MKLKHSVQERKREQEILARKQRELEREMRATKRKDIQVNLFLLIFVILGRDLFGVKALGLLQSFDL